MELDKTLHRMVMTTRIMHSVFLASVPAAIALVALLPRLGVAPIYESDDPTLLAIQITLGGLSLLLLTTGLLWPKLARWRARPKPLSHVLFQHVVRISLLEFVAVFGFVLGLQGTGWTVLAPLFVASAAALLVTFPTDRRLARWQGTQAPS